MQPIWDQIQPARPQAFVVAGPEQFYAMSGCRMASSPITYDIDDAFHAADEIDLIFNGVSAQQHCVAAQAAMGVR